MIDNLKNLLNISYRETISSAHTISEQFQQVISGKEQAVELKLLLEPLEDCGARVVFESGVSDKKIDDTLIQSVGEGVLEATSGGDFVDALADALIACIDLNWRNNARKLLVVFGKLDNTTSLLDI